MAIQPPSDLVLDVSRAADPLEYRASVEKLRNAQSAIRAANQQTSATGFSQMVKLADNTSTPYPSSQDINQLRINHKAGNNQQVEAYKKFEAFMLQSFIQNMFTTDTPSVFGQGQAGEYWKSMMAEAMAGELADHGGIGVAKMLERSDQIKQNSINAEENQDMKDVLGNLTGADKSPQAVVANIVQNKDIEFVRKQMSKNS
ncbi:rod-binding protein [uncultured Bartonella sp.]|uniref:rod-binding protein n=1 Tax=uncultured Bartonella sp. TaxID=104108 RepID=UPI00262C4CB6|nr:rod-binding protein [uncultured Bartonella sp.]